MAKIQNMMSKDFTVVHNTFLRDKKCKYCARGVLMTMLQKPNDYNFTIRGLASETDDGVTAVSTALKLLESLGYIKRVRITEKGRFVDLLYQISDEPIFKKKAKILMNRIQVIRIQKNLIQKTHMRLNQLRIARMIKQILINQIRIN